MFLLFCSTINLVVGAERRKKEGRAYERDRIDRTPVFVITTI